MTMTLISAADLASRLHEPGLRIFDVRHDLRNHAAGRRAYNQGHIPGARYLDHETELAAPRTGRNGRHPLPERAAFAALMARHGVTPATLVVAYDASGGMFAAHLWWMLRWLGYEKAAVLDGGWPAWLAADLPVSVESAAAAAAPASSPPLAPPLVASVDTEAVLNNLTQPEFVVIDARAAERYQGEVEPMDPVAGHIPGALNRPASNNLQPDGRFKPAAQLKQEFKALLGEKSPDKVVHQCGSGITACHNLLAMEVAGLTGSRLYPGSWSEWCSDLSRPIAKGA